MMQRLRYLLVVLFVVGAFLVGYGVGTVTPSASASDIFQTGGLDPRLERLERIWHLLHLEYVDQPVDDEALIEGAINGMLETLGDKHTTYMPPQEFQLFNESFSGSYSGIGAQVEAEGNKLFIVSPFDDSPAKEAGLLPGDEIVKVNDTLVSEFDDPFAAITIVRGPPGEPVTLQIRRGAETFDVTIIRAEIPLVSASGEMRDDGLGYVRVADFGQTTVQQLRDTLSEIMANDPQGLILDLRGNPGGSLDAAISVVSEFIGDGEVMIEEWGSGQRTVFTAQPGGLATNPDLPLVVLIDGGSASASEIVAGAIQSRGRGQLLGELTYGKGSVQSWHDLGAENGGVRITIARWLIPGGEWIHEKGITPDIIVEAAPADLEVGTDIQLESAVNLLLGKPLPTPVSASANKWRCCIRYE